MVITPIPRYLLPHSCTLIEKISSDGWGGAGKTVETTLEHVRIQPCHSQRFSLSGDIPEVSAKLLFDAVNSSPQNVSFETGDIIRFNGKDYVIQRIDTFYANTDRVHHLEVALA